MGVFDYKRRETNEVKIGNTAVGGENPIHIQSMTDTSTNDIDRSVKQIIEITDAGADIVRLTAQGIREVESLKEIHKKLRDKGYDIPLVADIHFNPSAAFAAASVVEKVRINPGNFADPGRVFKKIEYTEEDYQKELKNLKDKVLPFFELCKKEGTTVRIGVNHGSLSDRIMSRYGNTPAGMVESAMEFLRIANDADFKDIVISIKSSSTAVMVETVRRLVKALEREGMYFPIHLGVTEAGAGEDGRIKSAIGIGTLLAEGIGDTIRVSLSEHPAREIPVAKELVRYIETKKDAGSIEGSFSSGYDYFSPKRRKTFKVGKLGNREIPLEYSEVDPSNFVKADTEDRLEKIISLLKDNPNKAFLLTSSHRNPVGAVRAIIHAMTDNKLENPVVVSLDYSADKNKDDVILHAAADFGALLLDNIIDGIRIVSPLFTDKELYELALSIMQGSGKRISHTEFIACPGCGRTLFDLAPTLEQVRKATNHLSGLKIGVMGCIVNGPGEMAGADYGYVGAAKGRISLYRGMDCVEKNIPQDMAVEKLIDLIKKDGKWEEPKE